MLDNRTVAPLPESSSTPIWHALSAEETLASCGTSVGGLSLDEVARRQVLLGKNELPRRESESVLILLWRQINNPLIWVLVTSAFVAVLADPNDGLKNGAVILAVVTLNTLVGFVQEFRANKAVQALAHMVPDQTTVIRSGAKLLISPTELVRGDTVLLASGDKVPADMRLVDLKALRIDESILTGESLPCEKTVNPVAPDVGAGDRRCMAHAGTLVTYGTGTGVVTEIGAKTELGKISDMLTHTTDLETPLTKELRRIGLYITIGITALAFLMLLVGTFRVVVYNGSSVVEGLREMLIFAIALAVGAIPEGLPAIVTISLAIGVQRMAARNAIVRKLPAVETLGSTTVICSDKTGTLTRNEMTVQAVWTSSGLYHLSGIGYTPVGSLSKGDLASSDVPHDVSALLRAGVLCNDARLHERGGNWSIAGDPTEGALLVAACKLGLNCDDILSHSPRLDSIPFESENQFMATLHDGEIFLKGAPEIVLAKCSSKSEHDKLLRSSIEDAVSQLAAKGMRVLGFARKSFSKTEIDLTDASDAFEFLGLQGMIDPPRQEAKNAIQLCHGAGIVVKMITGDHLGTAQAIGKELGLGSRALSGSEIGNASPSKLENLAQEYNVFARVAPEHKLKLVQALQRANHVVAMTGDGVNDAPALKQSNIGVAMGITGTSVSKEAAAVVLADDNFASISAAVEEGRRVYDNLVKSLAFILPTNLGLALVLVIAVGFLPFVAIDQLGSTASLPLKELLLPLAPSQLLWINLVATVALALPLAFEAKEPHVMTRPPRVANAPILSAFLILRTCIVSLLMSAGCIGLFLFEFYSATSLGVSMKEAIAKAQTMAVTSVISFQIFYLFNCRSLRDSIARIGFFSNPAVFGGVALLIVLQLLFIYSPFLQSVFATAPLSLRDLLAATAVGAAVLPVVSLEKWLRNRKKTV